MPDSLETSIRLSLLPLAATVAILALPAVARAQASQGAIGVGATILAAPPAPLATRVTMDVDARGEGLLRIAPSSAGTMVPATTFVRITRDDEDNAGRVFVAPAPTRGVETVLRLPVAGREAGLRLERLIVAGT